MSARARASPAVLSNVALGDASTVPSRRDYRGHEQSPMQREKHQNKGENGVASEEVCEQVLDNTLADGDTHAGWLTRHDVAQLLEISLMSVRRRQETGELTGELVRGQWLFAPAEVDALAETIELDKEPTQSPTEPVSLGGEARALFSAAVALSRQAEAHNERLLSLIEAPASRLLEQTTGEAANLRERIAELEQKHTALLEASQRSLDRAHERQLREQEEQARLAMKVEALATLKQLAPILIGRVMGHLGDPKGATHVMSQGLLSSLTEEQLLQLFRSGIVSDAQGAMLASIVRSLAAERAKEPRDATQSEDTAEQKQDDKLPNGEGGEL
jgi:hypothetical protein